MLVDFQYLRNSKRLVVSYVDKSGEIKLKYYEWESPKKFVVCSPDDKDCHPIYKSWDGKCVKGEEVTMPDRYTIYDFLDALPENEKNEIFEYNLPKIYFVDIETEIVDGFPDAETAPTKVLSISIVYDDKIILLGLKDMPQDMQKRICDNTNKYFERFGQVYKLKYIKYEDEFDMLYNFFEKIVVKMPVITGWNFLDYDWKYLINRSRKLKKVVNGREYSIDPNVSSITKRLYKVWGTDYEMPQHRLVFDYMQLYEICDTSIKVKESSSLDFVSKKLIGVDKIKYTGSLQKLYDEDFETFMYYNSVDSVLVQKIHESKNYISIIYAISSLSKIKVSDCISQMNNALASLVITEGVLRNRFREQENIVLFRGERSEEENEGISGGWVKDPVTGMNLWCVTYDFNSMYPHCQLQWYIAPENFIGIQDKNNKEYCDNGVKISSEEHVVCTNGVVFRKKNSPTIQMLRDVYTDRKGAKKLMLGKKEELKKVLDEIKELESQL